MKICEKYEDEINTEARKGNFENEPKFDESCKEKKQLLLGKEDEKKTQPS
jgi:hypothetical protein